MDLRLSQRQLAVVFAAVLVVAIAGLYAATQRLQAGPVSTYVVHDVHLQVEGSDWTIRYESVATSNNTAFSLLIEASANLGFSVRSMRYEIPQGVLVTAINESVNGQGGLYWQYWVNGAYAGLAADHMALHDRDVVRWTFVGSMEGG